MKTLRFRIDIRADRATVWETMLAQDTYRDWTAEFAAGSCFEGSWEEGQRIRFLAPDGNGVSSIIAEHRPREFVSIKHIGMISQDVEDTESEAVRRWAPAFENYSFTDAGESTVVDVEMTVPPEDESHLATTWPKALARLRTLCEARHAAR